MWVLTQNQILGQIWSQNCNIPDFYEICNSEHIEHTNHEYTDWNWWPWIKIFGPKSEICFSFYEIWDLEQIEHANYGYST